MTAYPWCFSIKVLNRLTTSISWSICFSLLESFLASKSHSKLLFTCLVFCGTFWYKILFLILWTAYSPPVKVVRNQELCLVKYCSNAASHALIQSVVYFHNSFIEIKKKYLKPTCALQCSAVIFFPFVSSVFFRKIRGFEAAVYLLHVVTSGSSPHCRMQFAWDDDVL